NSLVAGVLPTEEKETLKTTLSNWEKRQVSAPATGAQPEMRTKNSSPTGVIHRFIADRVPNQRKCAGMGCPPGDLCPPRSFYQGHRLGSSVFPPPRGGHSNSLLTDSLK